MGTRKLTPEEQERAFQLAIEGQSYRNISKSLGFNCDMNFFDYRQREPEFERRLTCARQAGNILIEDEIREVADTYDDPQRARVKMESLCRILAFRDPAKYSQKVDITMHQTISLSSDIANANARIEALLQRDVTPLLEKPNDIEDLL